MTVEPKALIEVLGLVPDDCILIKNVMGNLAAYTRSSGRYVGYIDTQFAGWHPLTPQVDTEL